MKGLINIMNNKSRIHWIARTAIMLALLIVLQYLTSLTGITLITGSVVNLVLILTVMLSGLSSGLTVALISPVVAKLIGIGPLWSLIPFIALGNIVLVLLWHVIGNGKWANGLVRNIVAAVVAAAAKFLVLFLTIAKLMVPVVLRLPEPQASVISATFSTQQLVTALIGGAAAVLLVPPLQKALGKR